MRDAQKTGKTRLVKKFWLFGSLVMEYEYVGWDYESSVYPAAVIEIYQWRRL